MHGKLHEQLHIDLRAIDATLRRVIETDPDIEKPSLVFDSILRLIHAGGKRLRPIMAVVGGRFGAFERQAHVINTAVLLEYIHMASLIHDDIIDQSDLRRGELTLHKQTDVRTALHIANYMMARVVEWASMNEQGEIVEEEAYRCAEIAAVVTELCLGEFQQLDTRYNYDLTMEEYLEKTRRKTAVLMAECLQAGAKAAHAEPDISALLYQFGEQLGMAFQIQDDILDFTESQQAIGKPSGADLRSGNVTLPVLFALQDPQLAPQIRALSKESSSDAMQDVIDRIKASDAIERTRHVAREYADKAMLTITPLREHPSYSDLIVLANYFLK